MHQIYKRTFTRNDNKELLLYGYQEHTETPSQELDVNDIPKPHMRWNPSREEWVTYSAGRKDRTFFPPKEYCPLCPGANLNYPTEIPFKNFEVAVFPNRWASFNSMGENIHLENILTKPSKGECEVVVYSPKHLDTISEMTTMMPRQNRNCIIVRTVTVKSILCLHPLFTFGLPLSMVSLRSSNWFDVQKEKRKEVNKTLM